ncbi:PQQ-binding-like beta-propeller repeat protein [Pontiella agarivorans]|uniref:PQQ-binding-like beta-propeller repeat protein n=1 Tax=Pontiella agarivorans TaxID=3038953 RepID=A0ABU5MUL5_9BACT|nr:PQQ-binding-like beta-propeller repeat protein [Pontiella agarivorans]MDZ8117827.1 PQQ-binding-like beta-propeller repeat protein [Pontiella agarivorans]
MNKKSIFVLVSLIAVVTTDAVAKKSRRSARDSNSLSTKGRAPLVSHDTGYTIMKVRSAETGAGEIMVAGSYEGTVLGVDYDGSVLWTNALSGFMIHDMWCADITETADDEILVANADGTIYCLDAATGAQLWQFLPNDGGHLTPMYAVCSVKDDDGTPYVVCGAFDRNIYYVRADGTLAKTVESVTYSKERPWKEPFRSKAGFAHNANFLRPVPQADGSEHLALVGTCNHMQARGSIYLFEALADRPYGRYPVELTDMVGDFRVCDPDGDGTAELLLGSSSLGNQGISRFDLDSKSYQEYTLPRKMGASSYRVTQVETIPKGDDFQYLMLCGTHIVLRDDLNSTDQTPPEMLGGTYAYNDLWKDDAGRLILASSQSGGSCLHVIDPRTPGWKEAFSNLKPPGKIAEILKMTADVRARLATFKKPAWERDPVEVVLTQANPDHPVAKQIAANYNSPVFLKYLWNNHVQDPADWDRETVLKNNPSYLKKRDRRKKYDWTQEQVIADISTEYDGAAGVSMWAGHGTDPYYYSPATLRGLVDAADKKPTVFIWPEMNGSSEAFEAVMDHLFYPLADYMRGKNAHIYVRNKNVFWQGAVYLPAWAGILSGAYSDIFTSGLEETTDKTQDLSVAGRMGLWVSGALDSWGMRCSRDNPSFDRQRQHSYQRLPNHFLRNMVYNMAGGATFLNCTYVDADYMSLAWELVAKGALYIPKREEIVSFSPVHLSMKDPDHHYLEDAEESKWTVFYDQEFEQNNPFVFSRMNGSWPGAPVTPWDFSSYASGVKDRRQNFLPPYPKGLVLITPPQHGVFADTKAPRGAMTDHLHPMYRTILQEFITDGRHYYAPDGSATYPADRYYKNVSDAIEAGAQQLPITVSGDVAWVCAQTDERHLRLTLVDSGYLNPKARKACVHFNSVVPVKVTNVLSRNVLELNSPSQTQIHVPVGGFCFIDIELQEPFFPDNG